MGAGSDAVGVGCRITRRTCRRAGRVHRTDAGRRGDRRRANPRSRGAPAVVRTRGHVREISARIVVRAKIAPISSPTAVEGPCWTDARFFSADCPVCGFRATAARRGPALQNPKFSTSPFTLGVCSGDPSPDGVVLWTRLALDPLNGGGMPPQPIEVQWQIARTTPDAASCGRARRWRRPTGAIRFTSKCPACSRIAGTGTGSAPATSSSPVGRTRTMPARAVARRSASICVRLVPAFRTG